MKKLSVIALIPLGVAALIGGAALFLKRRNENREDSE